MANATDLAKYIGRTGIWKIPNTDISLRVRILDARMSYARLDLRIAVADPDCGTGDAWASRPSILMDEEEEGA